MQLEKFLGLQKGKTMALRAWKMGAKETGI
jgi:hypothetical protein